MKSFPDILLLDCTYKTNRFKMPLLVMVRTSYLNTTFYLGFAFLAEEKEEDYTWALEQVRNIYNEFPLPGPGVVVTDRDIALLNALHTILPQSHTILCIWHINKNVLAKVNGCFQSEEERTTFMATWNQLLDAASEPDFERQWKSLQSKYQQGHKLLIQYLDQTWLFYRNKIVKTWTNRLLHLGNTAISRVEGAHHKLKSSLQVSTGDLKTVVDKIQVLLTGQHSEFKIASEIARSRLPHMVNIPLFTALLGHVTPFALKQILKQYYLIRSGVLLQCTGAFRSTMGLPCAHEIHSCLYQESAIATSSSTLVL